MDSTVLAALIAAAAAVGTTLLAHYLKDRKSPDQQGATRDRPGISLQEAQVRITKRATQMGLPGLSPVRGAEPSPFGTLSFCADAGDEKGALYCHATGARRGDVYYVRKGIGWYYNHQLRGPSSFLGLPLSDEEDLSDGARRSLFEGGYIVWKRSDDSLSVFDTREGGEAQLVSRYHF
jgi:hypothetical protein